MRHRTIGGALLAAAAVLAGPGGARAQFGNGTAPFTDGSDGGFPPPRQPAYQVPIPTGAAGDSGFYVGLEYVMLQQTRAIGNQTIAVRGFYDLDGSVTGQPGRLVGSGAVGLTTKDFSPRTFQPGGQLEVGYKFEDGTRVFYRYLQLYDAHYSFGASAVPPGYSLNPNLADSFLSARVFNFNQFFAGPTGKVNGVPDTAVYGIWNAASQMDIKFTQRYQEMQAGARVPVLESEYSRVYASGGLQFNWFFERFQWRTVSLDAGGNARPQDVAFYTNTLSQRLYGPFVGCGHEVFVADQFSVSGDLTAAALLDVVKMRAKYKLGDQTVQSKFGREEFRVVPNVNAATNLWWYPVEGVQVRVGYQALTFFNTTHMLEPVGLNFGNIAPRYRIQGFRLVHGINAGIGFFF
jgi:hypothetical protein